VGLHRSRWGGVAWTCGFGLRGGSLSLNQSLQQPSFFFFFSICQICLFLGVAGGSFDGFG
jgi:hypothetical protein